MTPPPLSEQRALDPRWVLDTGRVEAPPAEDGVIRSAVRGEYQLRLHHQTAISLRRHGDDPSTDALDQGPRLHHWLRLNPYFVAGKTARLVAQADVPYGLIAGPVNRHVEAAEEPWNDWQPMRGELRWLFAEWSPTGIALTVGQQPSHFGLGVVENDGDHRRSFGDPTAGTRVERVGLAVLPGGARSATELRMGGELVFTDPLADLRDDDVAWRGTLALEYGRERALGFGVLLVGRHQRSPLVSAGDRDARRELLQLTVDVTGHASLPLADELGFAFIEGEVAVQHGEWSYGAPPGSALQRGEEQIRAHGGSARWGVVALRRSGAETWGRFVGEVEWGWSSGDADPYDAIDHRFRFAPGYRVGMLLFQEVMAWKSARSATLAADGTLGAVPRPEGRELATNGAITGATYLAPGLVVRPRPNLDLKVLAVIAQSTSDYVDPLRAYTDGRYVNFDGGTALAHDLGVEVDFGGELRIPLETGVCIQLGAEGAAFRPGYAFADADGDRNPPVYGATGRVGIQF